MARWMLIEPHYLNVAGTEWEYTEQERGTGKQIRRKFTVPRYLHPEDPNDWTEKSYNNLGQPVEGKVIVSDGNGAQPMDIIFTGDPTPNMLPLDDDAKAVSARYAANWSAPAEGFTLTHSQSLLDNLERKLALVQAQQPAPASQGMEQLMAAIAAMMKQNGDLITVLAGGGVVNPTGANEPSAPKPERRV